MRCFGRRQWRHREGLTLVEVVIALVLLLLVIPLGAYLLVFGSRSFAVGEAQSEVQQHVRLVADYLLREIRYSEDVVILGDQVDIATFLEDDWHCIYVDTTTGRVVHLHQGVETEVIPGLPATVEFALRFEPSSENTRMLHYWITGTLADGRGYTVDSEVLMLNASTVSFDPAGSSDPDGGIAIAYTSPRPAHPEIIRVTTKDRLTNETRVEHVRGADYKLSVDVFTDAVPNSIGATALLYIYPAGGEIGFETPSILVDTADKIITDNTIEPFWVDFLDGVAPAVYRIHVALDIPDYPVDIMPRIVDYKVWPEMDMETYSGVSQPDSVVVIDISIYRDLRGGETVTISGLNQMEAWRSDGSQFELGDFHVVEGDVTVQQYEDGTLTLTANSLIAGYDQPVNPSLLSIAIVPEPESFEWLNPHIEDSAELMGRRSDVSDLEVEFTVLRGATGE